MITDSLKIINSAFDYNKATTNNGGAIYNQGTLTLTKCTFTSNAASKRGGAIYNISHTLKAIECTFKFNKAAQGGAIFNYRGITIFSGSKFYGNSSNIYNYRGTVKIY